MKRRGKTIRLGDRAWRVTIPSRRCCVGRDGDVLSLGWLIVTKLSRPMDNRS